MSWDVTSLALLALPICPCAAKEEREGSQVSNAILYSVQLLCSVAFLDPNLLKSGGTQIACTSQPQISPSGELLIRSVHCWFYVFNLPLSLIFPFHQFPFMLAFIIRATHPLRITICLKAARYC